MIKIGICGPQGVGKSTLAQNLPFYELHMLDSSYEGMATILGVDRDLMENPKTKDELFGADNKPSLRFAAKTPRNIMDWWGDTFRAQFGESAFVELWCEQARKLDLPIILNTSIRFDYEAKFMDYVFELERDGVEYDGSKFNTRIDPRLIHSILSLDEMSYDAIESFLGRLIR